MNEGIANNHWGFTHSLLRVSCFLALCGCSTGAHDEPAAPTRATHIAITRVLSVLPSVDTVRSSSVPVIQLPMPLAIGADSFRTAVGLARNEQSVFVLDRSREPHVSIIDVGTGQTVRRLVSHVPTRGDTIQPEGLSLTYSDMGSTIILLDPRGRRLITANVNGRDATTQLQYNLKTVLDGSDNPRSVASASWGTAISGTMTNGTEVLTSADLTSWVRWTDSTSLRYGLPRESFMRAIASTNTVLVNPTRHLIATASIYQPSFAVINTDAGTMRHFVIDSGETPPAKFRLAEDKSVRITWKTDRSRYFVSVAGSENSFALLECGCRLKADTLTDRRTIWLFDWEGRAIGRLRSPLALQSITLSSDGQLLVGSVRSAGWNRLVRWSLTDILAGRNAGRSRVVQLAKSTKSH